jgi:hypothetical protein
MNRGLIPDRDLTRDEIIPIAQGLIRHDATTFLKGNYYLICNGWALSFEKASVIYNHGSASKSAIAKLDVLESIILNRENPSLVLRLAYFHLVPVIKALEYAAKVDQLLGQVPRKRGRSDTSATINSYLNFKGIPLDMKFFRSQLLRHVSISRRLSLLAGPSPLLFYAYIDKADEIIYVPFAFISLLKLILFKERGPK